MIKESFCLIISAEAGGKGGIRSFLEPFAAFRGILSVHVRTGGPREEMLGG